MRQPEHHPELDDVEGGTAAPNPRLGGVCVLYNRDLSTTPIGRVMSEHATEMAWVVLDNSELPDETSAHYARSIGVDYVWMGGNRGVSAAFNRGVVQLRPHRLEAIAFFDQDTEGVAAYVDFVLAHPEALEADVLMPLVRAGELILSPSRVIGGLWHRAITRPGHLTENFSCINSGMIVSTALLEKVPFDESLFLDYVDHRFVEDARRAGATFQPLWDCELSQDYSRHSDSRPAALTRSRIFRRDVRTFYSRHRYGWLWSRVLVAWRAVRESVRHRTFRFLAP